MSFNFGSFSYLNPLEIISTFDIGPVILLEDLTVYFKESN